MSTSKWAILEFRGTPKKHEQFWEFADFKFVGNKFLILNIVQNFEIIFLFDKNNFGICTKS